MMCEVTDFEHTNDLAVTLYRNSLQSKNTDFSIVVGNTKISCHSCVVCAQSTYFDSLYSSGICKVSLDDNILPKDGALLQEIIRYFYLGSIDLTNNTVVNVTHAAKFLKYDKLAGHCQQYMLATLNTENYRDYSAAAAQFHFQELSAACKEFPRRNFSAILSAPWFLPSVSLRDLVDYFKDDDLQVNREDEVLDALSTWMNFRKERDEKEEEDLEELIPQVRLSFCDPQKLTSLQDDKAVPAILRLKLYEFQRHGRKGEKPRNTYSATPVSSSPQTPGESDDPKIVLVGGRKVKNVWCNEIMYLNENHQNVQITTAELCDKSDLYSVCFTNEEDITISGGYSSTKKESVRSIHQYNTRTRQWRKLPDMKDPRSRHISLIIQHLLYIIAGCYESPSNKYKRWYKEVDVLNLVTGKWARVREIPHAVIGAGAAVVRGQIVVTGGEGSDRQWSKKTVRYNPSTDKWIHCAGMPESRAHVWNSTVPVGNRLFVLAHRDFLAYDITTDEWTVLTSPALPSKYCAMLLHNNTLVAVGGYEESEKNPHGRLQRYDLSTKKWSLDEESMTVPLSYHYACLMQLPK